MIFFVLNTVAYIYFLLVGCS